MRRGILVTICLAALVALVFAGAAITRAKPAKDVAIRAHKHYKIALVTGDNHDPFYVTMNQGAQFEARKLGVSVKWQGPAQFEAQLQIPILDAVLASRPDFLLVAPDDVRALINPLRKFNKKKVPVVTVDTDVSNHSVRLGNITSDNRLGGKIAASFLARALHGNGKVLFVGPQPGVFTTDQRKIGFEKALKSHPGLKYVGPQFDNDDPNQVASVVSAVLQRNPDLKGIFASDTFNGAGSATAVSNAGKRGKVTIIAFDAEPDQVAAVKRGLIQALIVQKAYAMGVLAVKYAVQHLDSGFKIPALTHPTYVIATKANINSPSVTKYLYHQK
jgi:ribose transport system substrate-binding protein